MLQVMSEVSKKDNTLTHGRVLEVMENAARVQWAGDQSWEMIANLLELSEEPEEEAEEEVLTCEDCGAEGSDETELLRVRLVTVDAEGPWPTYQTTVTESFVKGVLCRECAENHSIG